MARNASAGGTISVGLYRERTGFDYCCGYHSIGTVYSKSSSSPTALLDTTFSADKTSSKYYLKFYSQKGPTFVGSGTISQ